jgi:S-(hydroxymethyl)glutathione dehydrogenase/alcohol dehydrogenase
MKFRAAVLNKVNEPMTLDTLEMAALSPTDVLVKVKASGLCHTDLEVIQGSLAYPLPSRLRATSRRASCSTGARA